MSTKPDQVHNVASSLDGEMDFHATLLSVCKEIGKQKRPQAPLVFNSVVPEKPRHLNEARGRVRPADLERMKELSPDGTGFVMIRKVWRDAVIDALVSKAIATKMAIASLAAAGFGADAYALTRHLFENIIVVSWLLRPKDEAERAKRIDTYVAHFEAFKVRFEEVTRALAASVGDQAGARKFADLRAKEIAAGQCEIIRAEWEFSPSHRRPQSRTG